jgi:hypothetical protein
MIGWLMNMGQLMECEIAWKVDVLAENLSFCHLIHYPFHMT